MILLHNIYIYIYLIGQSDFINRQQFRGMFNLNYAPSITVSCVIFCKHYNTFDDETILMMKLLEQHYTQNQKPRHLQITSKESHELSTMLTISKSKCIFQTSGIHLKKSRKERKTRNCRFQTDNSPIK